MKETTIKLLLTAAGLALAAVRIARPDLQIDAITLGLIVFAALPWLASFVQTAKLPGGWEFEFRALRDTQDKQQSEIRTLQFLVSHFVTEAELGHLQALASDSPFIATMDDTTSFFEQELRRLRSLGLIAGHPGKGVRSMQQSGGKMDVKQHFFITDLGREYLKLRESSEVGAMRTD